MTTYKNIHGKKIKFLASDPPATVAEGQVWYNGADFKTAIFSEAWSSGGNLNVTRGSLSGSGTLTAGLVAGGTTATVAFEDATEEYDGTSWTNGGNLNTGRKLSATMGPQTAGFQVGGIKAPANTASANVEEWNGSAWSEVNNMPAAILGQKGCGVLTAALSIGGNSSNVTTSHYDGTNWSEGGNLTTGRANGGAAGTLTAAIVASGSNGGLQAATEIYDGTSWKNSSDVATARGECAGSKEGSTSSMTIAGGESPSRTNATEEFTAEFSVKTITDS